MFPLPVGWGSQLFEIAHGIGLESLAHSQAIAVYCATLAITLTAPSSVDLGIMEVSSAGTLVPIEMSRNPAIAVMLISRVLCVGLTLVIATIGAGALSGGGGSHRAAQAPACAGR